MAQRSVTKRNVSKIKPKISTMTDISMGDCTALPVDIAPDQETEYTDEQFYADLKKASKQLDSMAEKALEEHAKGKARKFPV